MKKYDFFKIASRSSPLALAQVQEIIEGLKTHGIAVNYELVKINTAGDKDKSTPLTSSPDNFFTDTIDQALLKGQADIAVHSAKDLPKKLADGLDIFALTECLDNKDAWVGRCHWHELLRGAKVGTSSLLRREQILQLRPDVHIVEIRGTIQERLNMVKNGQIDGVVMAACALKRLKLENEIKDIFPWDGQTLQGQLAVIGRQQDQDLKKLFGVLDVRPQKIFLHCGTHPEIYRDLGQIIHWPMIEIRPVSYDKEAIEKIRQAYEAAQVVIFTSPNAVQYFYKTLSTPYVPSGKTFAAIGQQTKEALEKLGIDVHLAPEEETAEGLFKALTKFKKVSGVNIFFPRSSLPNPFLKDALSSLGAKVTEITVYENVKPAMRPLPSEEIAGVIFTSPSTVQNFLSDYAIIPAHWQILAKGPYTLKTLQDKGYSHATSLS